MTLCCLLQMYVVDLGVSDPHNPWYPAIGLHHPGDMIRFRDTDIWAGRVFKVCMKVLDVTILDCRNCGINY